MELKGGDKVHISLQYSWLKFCVDWLKLCESHISILAKPQNTSYKNRRGEKKSWKNTGQIEKYL